MLLLNQYHFQHYFCVAIFKIPLPDAEKLIPPLKNSSPASENFQFPPCLWKFQNFFPTLNLGWERHYAWSLPSCNILEKLTSQERPKDRSTNQPTNGQGRLLRTPSGKPGVQNKFVRQHFSTWQQSDSLYFWWCSLLLK